MTRMYSRRVDRHDGADRAAGRLEPRRRARRRATPTADGHYLIAGARSSSPAAITTLTENIVHMTLARIDGAPLGIKGVSLFGVPKRRASRAARSSTTTCASPALFHKIGWRGIAERRARVGERGDCHGWLVGEPHRGIRYMFQMMNEARIMVGHQRRRHGVGRVSRVARLRARAPARPAARRRRDPRDAAGADHRARRRAAHAAAPEGDRRGRALRWCVATARYADLAAHARDADERRARAAAARSADADRQVVPRRARLRVERARRADPRRLRLHERVPARGVAARPEAQQHPRGHDRHPGDGSRSAARWSRIRAARLRVLRGRDRRRDRRARRGRGRARMGAALERAVGAVVGELTMELAAPRDWAARSTR